MVSDTLMKFLIFIYMITFICCLFEKNFPKALYWLSASMITLSIILGMKN